MRSLMAKIYISIFPDKLGEKVQPTWMLLQTRYFTTKTDSPFHITLS